MIVTSCPFLGQPPTGSSPRFARRVPHARSPPLPENCGRSRASAPARTVRWCPGTGRERANAGLPGAAERCYVHGVRCGRRHADLVRRAMSRERWIEERTKGGDGTKVGRRPLVQAAAATAAGTLLLRGRNVMADAPAASTGPNLAAVPPAGFVPFTAPGRIVKVTKSDSLMPNKLYPKADDARRML